MKLSQRFLRLLDHKREEQRMELRECLARTQACAEDVDRTIVKMNGHAQNIFADLKPPIKQ